MNYSLLHFLKDIVPFALAAFIVMAVTNIATESITNLWVRLLSRALIATVLYYAVMRLSGAVILQEIQAFILKRKR
jgi:hypothetical protein